MNMNPDMIFVKKVTRPEFLKQKFYTKKRVNRDNGKFATKQRKCFKIHNLRQKMDIGNLFLPPTLLHGQILPNT